jgi:hypothetical protein
MSAAAPADAAHTEGVNGPETLLNASMASLGDFAAMPFGVGTPYWCRQSKKRTMKCSREGASAYRIEKIHGLVFMDG